MLVASRLRRQSSQIGASSSGMSDNEESEDSETEDQDSDEDVMKAKLITVNEYASESKCEEPGSDKEEEVEELMDEIEEDCENKEEQEEEHRQEAEGHSEVEQEEQVQPITSLSTDNYNYTASSRAARLSPSVTESQSIGSIETFGSELGGTMNDNFQEERNDFSIKTSTPLPSNMSSIEVAGVPVHHLMHVGIVDNCTSIFVEEAGSDSSSIQFDSEA